MLATVELFFVTILQYTVSLRHLQPATLVESLPNKRFLSHLLSIAVTLNGSMFMRLEIL
jgi:hypothetical protein